jgi:hypothetical protein
VSAVLAVVRPVVDPLGLEALVTFARLDLGPDLLPAPVDLSALPASGNPNSASPLLVALSGKEEAGAEWRGWLRRRYLRRRRCDLRDFGVELSDLVLAPEGRAEAVVGDRRHHEELGLRRVKPRVQPVCAFHVDLLAATPSWRSAWYAYLV